MPSSVADHPGPDELAAYADREASAEVRGHVAVCSVCAGRAASDFQLQRSLESSLYRFDCPSPHTLGEYELDFLDAVQRTTIAAHARACDECRAELHALRVYLAAPTPVPDR